MARCGSNPGAGFQAVPQAFSLLNTVGKARLGLKLRALAAKELPATSVAGALLSLREARSRSMSS